MGMLRIKEISQKYGIPTPTLRYWIRRGWIKTHQMKKGTNSPMYIDELDIPAWARKRYGEM
jgi:predicted site-specific integrase-resolvase